MLIEVRSRGLADGVPLVVGTLYLSAGRFPGAAERLAVDASVTSLFESYGIDDYRRRTTRVSARLPTAGEARLLRQARTQPVLVTQKIDVDRRPSALLRGGRLGVGTGAALRRALRSRPMLISSRRLVFRDGTIGPGSLRIEDGMIVEVGTDGGGACLDVGDLLVAPGLVDMHGDAFERQLMPRPGVMIDLEVALLDTDRQLASQRRHHGLSRHHLVLGAGAAQRGDGARDDRCAGSSAAPPCSSSTARISASRPTITAGSTRRWSCSAMAGSIWSPSTTIPRRWPSRAADPALAQPMRCAAASASRRSGTGERRRGTAGHVPATVGRLAEACAAAACRC